MSTQHNKMQIVDACNMVDDMAPAEEACMAVNNEIFCYSVVTDYNGNVIYTDLARLFPIESYKGINYYFIVYIYKCKYIMVQTMKSRRDEDMISVF